MIKYVYPKKLKNLLLMPPEMLSEKGLANNQI